MPQKLKNVLFLALCIFICFIPATTGFFLKPGSWYESLIKPALNPPNWIFGPVWTILYILMGICLWRIFKAAPLKQIAAPLGLFALQLIFNGLWTWLFFGLQNPCYALINIFILLGLILFNIIVFHPIDKIAAYLLIPYLLWVSFATYLNFELWRLN